MSETLAQALRLTVLGMGMTFASIGALVLGMLAMTYLTNRMHFGRGETGERGTVRGWETGGQAAGKREAGAPYSDEAAQAVAAAVAVALADQAEVRDAGAAQAAAAAVAVCLATQPGPASGLRQQAGSVGAWDSFVRGAHLSRRARYESRRVR
ncbi:MAG: hypothetical protein JXC32_03585 [Anaerolineae bacterium]|nr:hypothetical protein [Anaerolineae bacterium]